MDQSQTQIINVSEAREALTGGDFRNDIAFQNDVNHLISVIDELFDEALLQRLRDRRATTSAPSLHG